MSGRPAPATLVIRYGLPVLLVIGGVVLIVVGHGREDIAAGGVVILGIALMVWMLGWLFRMSIVSNSEREREEAARDYFARHGHWPGE